MYLYTKTGLDTYEFRQIQVPYFRTEEVEEIASLAASMNELVKTQRMILEQEKGRQHDGLQNCNQQTQLYTWRRRQRQFQQW